MQRLLERACWDAFAAMAAVRAFAAGRLGDPADAVLVIDESGQEKAGEHTAGVQRQYLGCAGRVANGINVVYASYAAPAGHAIIAARLYVPKDWAGDSERRTVAVDLRDDWPAALRAAGFDPAQPTAWSAEGLLGYLPPEAQDRLLDTITELSVPGSRLATESAPNPEPGDDEKLKERMRTISERWRAHGFDLDMAGLVYFGDRNEAAPYLAGHGWRLKSASIRELFAANGLDPLSDDDTRMGEMLYTSGTYE